MDASSAKEVQQSANGHQDQSQTTEQHLQNGGVSFALPQSLVPADEAGAAQTNGYNTDNNHSDSDKIKNFPNQSHTSERNNGGDGDAGCDAARAIGDILSPDSEVVTVICQPDNNKNKTEQEKDGCDGYETHSDSIETLDEEDVDDSCAVGSSGSRSVFPGFSKDFSPTQPADPDLELTLEGEDVFEGEIAAAINKTNDNDISNKTNDGRMKDSETGLLFAANRPESLSLPRPLQYFERKRSSTGSEAQQGSNQRGGLNGGHQRSRSEAMDIGYAGRRLKGDLGCGDDVMSTSLPHGTILRKGDMIEFVADDLTEKIKRSSPMSTSRADSSSIGSRRSSQRSIASTSSATSTSVTSGVSRSPSSLLTQSPDTALPAIDPGAVMELETAARRVADSVDLMMGNLRNNLHKMSAITVGCSEAYKTSVDITCDSVDSSIKSMYALMAKCEELSASMVPVYQVAAQITEIKRILDLFEGQLLEKS